MKLHARNILKYASLTVLGLAFVHLAARVVAGFATLNSVFSPTETESSIFWMGFWQFRYTSERFTPEMNALQPIELIAPHVIVLVVSLLLVLAVFTIKYFAWTTSEQMSKVSLALSITAILISAMSLVVRAMMI